MKNDLGKKILDISNKINKYQRIPKGNWIITGSQVANKLQESLDGYEQDQIIKSRDENRDNLLNGEEKGDN